jgi:hypothetical protein
LWAVPQLQEQPHGPQTVRATNPHTGKSAVLPIEVVNALTYCAPFRTLDEHTDELLGEADPHDPRRQAIRSVLQQVRQAGLTVSARRVLDRLKPVPVPPEEGPVAAAIITCDRPFALERLLASIMRNADTSRLARLIVVDDSRLESNRQRNRQLTDSVRARCQAPLHYFGADEAQAFVNRLVERLPGLADPIRCLLDQHYWTGYYSAGVARNFSHMLALDCRLAVFDDDTVCEFWPSPAGLSGCEFNAARRQALFYEALEMEPRLRVEDGEDPVARLTQCLGLTVPQALFALGIGRPDEDSLRFSYPDAAMAYQPGSRVLVTECASLGDPGTADDAWLGLLPDETLLRFQEEPGQAEAALAHWRCWLGPNRPSFATRAHMSQLTGFDNRELLPPYMPVERGQDQIFGEMTRFLHPESVALTHPWAVKHLRIGAEGGQGPTSQRMSPDGRLTRMSLLPGRRAAECTRVDLAGRFGFLGQAFHELATLSNGEIIERATSLASQQADTLATQMQEQLERFPDLPEAYRRHVQGLVAELRDEQNLKPDTGEDETVTLDFWRNCWGRFGKALESWPEIRAEAAEIQ